MIEAIASILGGGGLGLITGAIGSYLSKKQQIEIDKNNQAHEARMAEIELKEAKLNRQHAIDMADKQIDIAESEGKIKIDLAEMGAFSNSQKTSHPWMEIARSIMRPLITGGLIIWMMVITYQLSRLVGGLDALPADELVVMYKDILTSLTSLTMMATSWWFGSRPPKKA